VIDPVFALFLAFYLVIVGPREYNVIDQQVIERTNVPVAKVSTLKPIPGTNAVSLSQ